MMRRITAALLALIILMSAVPVTRVNAEETIYKKGEELRLETEDRPLPYDPSGDYPTARGYMWELQLDKNGAPIIECTKPVHTCDRYLCFDDDEERLESCPGPHKHQTGKNSTCTKGYVWKVVRDPDYILWFDDPLAPENYELAVCCYEPDGIVPMAGVGLYLFQVIEKEDPDTGGKKKINDSILPVDPENPENNERPITNKNGYYYFTGECKNSIPAGDHTWYLVQRTEEFQAADAKTNKPEGKYYNQYRSNNVKWEVDVYVNGDGTYTVNDVRDPNGISLLSEEEEDEYPKPIQGYDAENQRLVILNQPINVIINIDLINVPASLSQLDATIKGPNGFEKQVQITKDSGRWHYDTQDWEVTLESGEYTVEAQTGRYPVVYMVNRSKEEPVEGNTLALDKEHQNGFFTIHFASLSNTVKLYAVDENDKPAPGAVYGIYADEDNYAVVSSDEESIVTLDVDNWRELAQMGKTLTIRQTGAPENHDLAENEYTLLLTETGDEVEPYAVELLPKTGDVDVRYGEKNEQIATFVNKKHDLSYRIIPDAVDQENNEAITEGSVYTLTNAETEMSWDVYAGRILDMKDLMAEAYEAGWKSVEFSLTQKSAPDGYELSKDSYTVTVTEGENGAVSVEMTKDANVFKKIAMFFTGDGIGRGDFGEWKPVFTNVKRAIPHSNTVIIRALDGDSKGLTGAEYEIDMDGESIGVKFPGEFNDGELKIGENSKGEITINSEGWKAVGMKLYMASMGDDNQELKDKLKGDGVEMILRQTKKPDGHESAEEEYPIIIRMAKPEDNIEDQFFIKLKDAPNGTTVQYQPDGTQIATFINEEMKEDVAYVSLALSELKPEDIVWNDGCTEVQRFMDMEYAIGLYMGDNTDPVETLRLQDGEAGNFQTKIPLGQAYTVRPTETDPLYNITFTNTAKAETAAQKYTGESQVSETVALTADISYVFERGEYATGKELKKIDSKNGNVLEGAEFILKDASGEQVGETIVTDKDGIIRIAGLNPVPARYTLQETKAPEGYVLPKETYPVTLKYDYTPKENNGKIIAVQNLIADEDEPKVIKNTKENDVDPDATAQIQLTLEDVVLKNKSACKEDREGFSEYNSRTYKFALSWKNEAGKWVEESDVVELKSGSKRKSAVFAKELPVGTEYKITSADSNRDYNIIFNGTVRGEEYEDYVKQAGVVDIKAEIEYIFEPGSYDKPDLYLKKVYARDANKTLAGARFTLKDEDAEVLETYKTAKDGIIEIIDQLNDEYPAEYTLKENKAPDDYIKLDGVIHISVYYDYTSYDENGKIIIRQDLVAEASHKDVTKGKDGYYYIKNTHKNDNPKTGDAFNAALWLSALLVSGAALSYVLIAETKKRRAR